jgi:hypothetical protein
MSILCHVYTLPSPDMNELLKYEFTVAESTVLTLQYRTLQRISSMDHISRARIILWFGMVTLAFR